MPNPQEDELDPMITEFLEGIGHPELIAHCMDTDENPGERLRQRIRQYAVKARMDELEHVTVYELGDELGTQLRNRKRLTNE